MKFKEVVDFPYERDAYMILKKKLGLSEEEYLKLSYIERREFSQAYRLAKKLGLEKLEDLREGYRDTSMFDEKGNFDIAEAVLIIKSKLAILSVAKAKLGLIDAMDEFVLKGDHETRMVAREIIDAMNQDLSSLAEHIRILIQKEANVYTESRFELQ